MARGLCEEATTDKNSCVFSPSERKESTISKLLVVNAFIVKTVCIYNNFVNEYMA